VRRGGEGSWAISPTIEVSTLGEGWVGEIRWVDLWVVWGGGRTHCSGAFDWVAGLGAVAFAYICVSSETQYGAGGLGLYTHGLLGVHVVVGLKIVSACCSSPFRQ